MESPFDEESGHRPWPKECIFGLSQKDKQIAELYVVIDTLQTNLRSAVSYLSEEQMKNVENHSYRWCSNWKAGDEKR